MPGRACHYNCGGLRVGLGGAVGLGVCGSSVHGGTVGVAGCVVVRGAGAIMYGGILV